jgi:hypothetical protein
MKTQIITLETHDDLVSVRDRMSWAKSPRILLVWPAHAQVALQPLDLRILQQHASSLGAQLGLVTRRAEIRRDATSFGIPVFLTTTEAQRGAWPRSRHGGRRKPTLRRHPAAELREMSERLRAKANPWTSRPAPRIGFFSLAVLAVISIASLFVPRAVVELTPITEEQSAVIVVEIGQAVGSGVLGGTAPSRVHTITVSGTRTVTVETRSEVPTAKATGTVEFRNLTVAPLVIPSGTIVYSVSPQLMGFVTLAETPLEGGTSSSVDVRIEALEAGEIGNLPAESIHGVEGQLSAKTTVSNAAPTTGGNNELQSVPSQAERDELRASLIDDLRAQAEAELLKEIEAQDVLLPGGIEVASIDEERYEPAPGQPASVLSLDMTATFAATSVQGADLQRLAATTLNGSIPPGYDPRPESLEFVVNPAETRNTERPARIELQAARTVIRHIDLQQANVMVRGETPARAAATLEARLPLAAPPVIKLTPSWWPWLPLIPFRIDVVIV